MNRRRMLGAAGAIATAAIAGPSGLTETARASGRATSGGQAPSRRSTVLAIGAHYDDCPFGIPGILLQAVAKGHRVVVLAMIGDYSNWKPVRGRGPDLVDGTRRINADYGVESRFLTFASGTIRATENRMRAVADVVAEVAPDVAFVLWGRDQHPDHEAAAELSKTALHLGDRVREDPFAPFATPRRTYLYDNGPRHTIGFVPDTFVDITGEFPRAVEWLGRLMALTRNAPYDPSAPDGAQRLKESIARYRGATCGVQYAEALSAVNAYPQALF